MLFIFSFVITKKIFVGLSLLIALLGLAYIAQKYHFLGIQFEYDGFLVGGLIRGVSEMSLGVYLAYLIDEYLKKERNFRVNPIAGILIRVFSYIVLFNTMWTSQWNVEDFTIFIPIIMLILISYVDPIKIPFKKIITKFVGLSYWVYLLHIIVSHVMVNYFSPFNYVTGIIVYLFISVLLSMVLNYMLKKMINNVKKLQKTY